MLYSVIPFISAAFIMAAVWFAFVPFEIWQAHIAFTSCIIIMPLLVSHEYRLLSHRNSIKFLYLFLREYISSTYLVLRHAILRTAQNDVLIKVDFAETTLFDVKDAIAFAVTTTPGTIVVKQTNEYIVVACFNQSFADGVSIFIRKIESLFIHDKQTL